MDDMAVLARSASSRLRAWGAPHEDKAARDRRRPAAGDLTRAIFGRRETDRAFVACAERPEAREADEITDLGHGRSEEHTSELQSRFDLVCRLLLEKKK